MERTITFAAAVIFICITQPVVAAEMTLLRNSRPVTEAEAAGGAPTGGMVHDFYATSDADLLCLVTQFNQQVYQHPYGTDDAAPSSELIAYSPAVGADSFFSMPGSTLVLGSGFDGLATEKAWADLSNDGPQKNFLFGRLTTTEAGSFAGYFALRGNETYIPMPFNFTLPGASGPLSEALSVLDTDWMDSEFNPDRQTPSPSEPEKSDPFASAPFSPLDTPVSIEISRRTRLVTKEEIEGGAPDGYVHEFFVSSSTDLIGLRDIKVDAPLFQHPRGLDNRRPHPGRLETYPALSADSFLTMPGWTAVESGFDAAATDEKTWHDEDDTGATTDFLFGQLTTDQTGSFSGTMVVRGPTGAVELPFSYLLPGTVEDLALIEAESTFTLKYPLDPAGRAQTTGQIPEPSTILLAAFAAAAVQLQRVAAQRLSQYRQVRIS